MIIIYTVTPIPFFRSAWATEITQIDSPSCFVDEQRFGSYRFWHHKHFFTEAGDKTEVRDLVHYSLPFGLVGRLANLFFVSRKLDFIFRGFKFETQLYSALQVLFQGAAVWSSKKVSQPMLPCVATWYIL